MRTGITQTTFRSIAFVAVTILLAGLTAPLPATAQSAQAKLRALGYRLPTVAPLRGYAHAVQSGNLVFVSDEVPLNARGKVIGTGTVGKNITVDAAREAAKWAALSTLSAAAAEAGGIGRLKKIIAVEGKVACADSSIDPDTIVSTATQVLGRIFAGEGKPIRKSSCVQSLKDNVSVVISAIYETR